MIVVTKAKPSPIETFLNGRERRKRQKNGTKMREYLQRKKQKNNPIVRGKSIFPPVRRCTYCPPVCHRVFQIFASVNYFFFLLLDRGPWKLSVSFNLIFFLVFFFRLTSSENKNTVIKKLNSRSVADLIITSFRPSAVNLTME